MAKKIPLPRVKSKKMSFSEKLFAGIAGLSPFTAGKPHLYQSMTSQTAAGRAAQAKHAANLLAKYGKWGTRAATLSGLTNPWVSIPFALTYGAKHLVGNALESYKNQDVEDTGSGPLWLFDNRGISAAGNERLLQERLAREDLSARRNLAREEGVGFWERARMKSEGGIARLL